MATAEIISKVTELVKEAMAAPSCCAELKEVGQAWLDAVGTDAEAEATKTLIAELKEDVSPIDGTIAFFESDAAAGIFGEEFAKEKAAHMKEIKAAGAVYCDCPACTAGAKILELEGELV